MPNSEEMIPFQEIITTVAPLTSFPNVVSSADLDNKTGLPFNLQREVSALSEKKNVWVMPQPIYISCMVVLSFETTLGLLSNLTLIGTIRFSPTLKTPPNCQLISICVNNLLLVVAMILSLCSLHIPDGSSGDLHGNFLTQNVLSALQIFLISTAWLQYWSIFSAIAFYRYMTLKKQTMSLRTRKKIIYRSIWMGWFLSLTLGSLLTIAFHNTVTSIAWNPFRQTIHHKELERLSFYQNLTVFLVISGFIFGLAVLLGSYFRIFKTLRQGVRRPIWANRVFPMTRPASISSDDNDLTMAVKTSYRISDGLPRSPIPFAISGPSNDPPSCVHYHKKQQSVTMDILALENPLRMSNSHQFMTKQDTVQENSLFRVINDTGNDTTNPESNPASQAEFTDITPSGQIQRANLFSKNFALRNQSIKHDRISLSGATKNSLVMMLTYVAFSFPISVCCFPGVLRSSLTDGEIAVPILFCKLLFFLNSPACPLWYLIFSRRVRKCLNRLVTHWKVRLRIRL